MRFDRFWRQFYGLEECRFRLGPAAAHHLHDSKMCERGASTGIKADRLFDGFERFVE